MRIWLSLARFGGVALALGLFASATATAASAPALYAVEPANVFAARGAVSEEDDDPTPVVAENAEYLRRKRAREAAVTTILGHNPFCEDCPPPSTGPVADAPGGPAVASATPPRVEVLATMEAEDPAHSLATIYDPTRGTWAAAVGDTLEPGVLVAAIGPGQITYSRGAATGVLNVGAPQPEAREPARPKERKPPRTPTAEKPDPLEDRVKCDAGQRCTIERSLIQDAMSNPATLGGIRAFPAGGGGFKLAGIRRGTLAHKLGLRNGDVLTGVGGKQLESLDDALALVPLLRSASNLEVTLSRRGKPITHEIEIV